MVLIITFTIFVCFFDILEDFVIKAFGFEISGKIREKRKKDAEIIFQTIVPSQINPEGTELGIKEITTKTISDLKKIYEIIEEEK